MGEAIPGNFVMAFVSIATVFGLALFALIAWLYKDKDNPDE